MTRQGSPTLPPLEKKPCDYFGVFGIGVPIRHSSKVITVVFPGAQSSPCVIQDAKANLRKLRKHCMDLPTLFHVLINIDMLD